MFSRRSAALGLLALAASWPSVVTALDPDICATITTNDQNTFTDNLQTNGLCKTHCQGKAAFAITKGYDCWCSNYAPAQAVQVDLSDCNFPCWGYPDEPCGGDNGEYSYVRLEDIQPSGTRGGDQPSSTASSKPSKTQDDPEPSEPLSTSDEPVTETEQAESETTASSSTKSSAKTTSEPTSSSVKTVTLDGTIKTVFVVPTEAPTSDGDSNQTEGEQINGGGSGGSGGGVSKGALAGIVVGVALGVIAILGVGLWFFFRRRRNQQQEEDYQEDPSIRGSSSGMMGSGNRPEMSMGGGSPGSPNTNSNRNSALMIDPRMDPFKQGLYVRSASHESINTLRDDHDYSRRIQQRTLRATNPDPEPAG